MIITQHGEWNNRFLYQALWMHQGAWGQGWLPGGGEAAVVRRTRPGKDCSWQGTLSGQRSGGWKQKQFPGTGAQRGGEEARAQGWDRLLEGLMGHVKGLGPLFIRIL